MTAKTETETLTKKTVEVTSETSKELTHWVCIYCTTKNEKVLSQLSFEQTVPINFQDSKQKWKTEQYKQWGCLGVHKDSSVKLRYPG